MKKLFGLRWRTYRSYFWAAVLSSLLTAVILQAAWPLLQEAVIDTSLPVVIAVCFFLTAIVVNMFIASRESKRIKKRLDDVAAFTAVLARGNLSQRMAPQKDEIGRVTQELNRLAETMERHVSSLQRLADDNEALAGKVHSAAIIEERQRLARDLHDAVSQQLFALTMLSEAADATMQSGAMPEPGQIRDIAELAAQVQQEMRALLLHLRPVQLSEETLPEALQSLVQELEQKSGLKFKLALDPLPSVPRGVENHLFRIVQEALANILRHAQASEVSIQVFAREGELFLQIGDNGRGFDPQQEKKASYGLKTMRERCAEVGGQLSVTSREGSGTRIDVRVPLKGESM
ncbi:sensor histidine kinase [Dethiobacter alkaliphilus]|uniref:sensor histidine kinase n=1 Tax=Dethiobacter alkaliphilus TaxID=427926 RepID=UPI002226B200|nr:sensor histidine kinase [Dethiobacter alkaliphilus]MCW3490596.1 sensor histidine kinase [Dethiobacter alkaliphilus]